MKNIYYMLEVNNNYMNNELERNKDLDYMLRILRHNIFCDLHYEVKHNKNKTYTLYKVVENDGEDNWYDAIKTISVKDCLYMSYEDFENLFRI